MCIRDSCEFNQSITVHVNPVVEPTIKVISERTGETAQYEAIIPAGENLGDLEFEWYVDGIPSGYGRYFSIEYVKDYRIELRARSKNGCYSSFVARSVDNGG